MKYVLFAYSGSHAVWGVFLRPLACWNCGLESRRWHGCLSLMSVVCCQVEVSATGRSLVQMCPTVFCASGCDVENTNDEGALAHYSCRAVKKKCVIYHSFPNQKEHRIWFRQLHFFLLLSLTVTDKNYLLCMLTSSPVIYFKPDAYSKTPWIICI